MQVLIVAATEMEIAPFLQEHPAADHLITGVGAPVAVYHIAKRLHQIDYDMVIQAGIAGSFTKDLSLGEIVLIEKDHFADLAVFEKNILHTVFENGLADAEAYPFKAGALINDHAILKSMNLKKVTAVTVNMITDDDAFSKRLSQKFNATVESMEGAALHYACMMENVPFLQVRAISNYVGERDKTKWKMKEAIGNLNKELALIFEKLINHSTEQL